jgi:hypothetical protein
LAKTAKLFGVPTILTTVLEERGGSSGVALDWEMQLLGVAG